MPVHNVWSLSSTLGNKALRFYDLDCFLLLLVLPLEGFFSILILIEQWSPSEPERASKGRRAEGASRNDFSFAGIFIWGKVLSVTWVSTTILLVSEPNFILAQRIGLNFLQLIFNFVLINFSETCESLSLTCHLQTGSQRLPLLQTPPVAGKYVSNH